MVGIPQARFIRMMTTLVTLAVLWELALCGGVFVEAAQEDTAPSERLRAFAYECDDQTELVARFEPAVDEMTLILAGRTVRLSHVRSGSGARYSDGKTTFWSKRDEATLVTIDGTTKKCREIRRKSILEDAKLRGVELYGRGNEPGWRLEVGSGEIVFETNYGQDTYRFPKPNPEMGHDNLRTVYRVQSDGHELTAEIHDMPCADDMSGEAFERTVIVTLDGREHRGCGHVFQ
jgi:putative lipoprotein